MEHLVPEQMFSTEENKAEGISAVKAIAIAAAEGQKIYTINNDNLEIALANITLAEDTETEIRNSVNAGYVVTAHEKQINFNGWLGEGYIITDPITGDAAYKISGGGNGGEVDAPGVVGGLLGTTSTIIDLALYGARESSDAAIKVFELLLNGISKLFSGISSLIGNTKTVFDVLDSCPIEAAALILPAIIFLTILMAIVVSFVGVLAAIFVSMFAGLFLSKVSSSLVDVCKRSK